MNVAIKQIEPVIRSVLRNIASLEIGALPKPSTLSGMLAEMKCIAYQQISDELGQLTTLPCTVMVPQNWGALRFISDIY
jgi:hypothetical protein